jgi:Sulfotransferase family
MLKSFIVCAPRTRSTLLTAVLGSHPDICALPEMNWAYNTIGELLKFGLSSESHSFMLDGPIRAIAKILGKSEDTLTCAEALRFLMNNQNMSILHLMDILHKHSGKKVLIEKSPSSSLIDTNYPNVKYILLSRSDDLIKEGLKEMPNITHFMDEETILMRSQQSLNWLRENREYIDVDAEDFIKNTEEVLIKICHFLEIEYVEMKSENWAFAKRGVWFAEYGGDPIFMNNPIMRKN